MFFVVVVLLLLFFCVVVVVVVVFKLTEVLKSKLGYLILTMYLFLHFQRLYQYSALFDPDNSSQHSGRGHRVGNRKNECLCRGVSTLGNRWTG